MVKDAGKPTKSIAFIDTNNFLKFKSGEVNKLIFLRNNIINDMPKMYEKTVAKDAPFIPSASIGPNPKIKIGSKTALIMEVKKSIIPGVKLSPKDLIAEFEITKQPKKGVPKNHINIYSLINPRSLPSAPINLNTGKIKLIPKTEIITIVRNFTKSIFDVDFFAFKYSEDPRSLDTTAATPIAIPILKLIIIKIIGRLNETAARGKTPKRPI